MHSITFITCVCIYIYIYTYVYIYIYCNVHLIISGSSQTCSHQQLSFPLRNPPAPLPHLYPCTRYCYLMEGW